MAQETSTTGGVEAAGAEVGHRGLVDEAAALAVDVLDPSGLVGSSLDESSLSQPPTAAADGITAAGPLAPGGDSVPSDVGSPATSSERSGGYCTVKSQRAAFGLVAAFLVALALSVTFTKFPRLTEYGSEIESMFGPDVVLGDKLLSLEDFDVTTSSGPVRSVGTPERDWVAVAWWSGGPLKFFGEIEGGPGQLIVTPDESATTWSVVLQRGSDEEVLTAVASPSPSRKLVVGVVGDTVAVFVGGKSVKVEQVDGRISSLGFEQVGATTEPDRFDVFAVGADQ